jgi:thiol-disulfide isomerase/thioredoxin
MKLKNAFVFLVIASIFVGLPFAAIGNAEKQNQPVPSYGSGPIEVRLYTNYFCGPCRAMEQDVEPILKELVRKNAIRLILVDVPFDEKTDLFSKYFLYAIKSNNDLEYDLRVRNILFEASTDNGVTLQPHVEALFKKKEIPFSPFDAVPILERYKALMTDGHVKNTPTCVIIKGDGKKRRFSGGPQITYALNLLK